VPYFDSPNAVLRIFLRVVQSHLHQHCLSAKHVDAADIRLGAVAFIQRFGSSLGWSFAQHKMRATNTRN